MGSRGHALLAGLGKGLLYKDVVDGEEPATSRRESSCVARAPDPHVGVASIHAQAKQPFRTRN